MDKLDLFRIAQLTDLGARIAECRNRLEADPCDIDAALQLSSALRREKAWIDAQAEAWGCVDYNWD